VPIEHKIELLVAADMALAQTAIDEAATAELQELRSAFEPTDASGGTGALTDEVGNTIDPGVTSTDPSVDAAFDADAGSGGASGGSHIQ